MTNRKPRLPGSSSGRPTKGALPERLEPCRPPQIPPTT